MNHLFLKLFYRSDMTQSEFCDKHGITRVEFRKYRDGDINIKFNTLKKIAEVEGYDLNVTLEPK